ncbi:MAG: DUF5011 domain-containing protein [Bacteroidetes bacterium]|nr:DUF5011 domain-containing protein [Bacteroidota bacterium]
MKKGLLIITSILMAGMFIFTSCTDDEDTTPPVIILTGGNTMDVVIKSAAEWTDPGFTATDNEDGTITIRVLVTGTVDITKLGVYTITYKVSDNAGNSTTVTRTVNIVVDRAVYLHTYAVADTVNGVAGNNVVFLYNVTITAGSTPEKLLLQNFAGFGAAVFATVNWEKSGTLTIPDQHLTGSPGFEGQLTGSGTTDADGNGMHIIYSIEYDDGSGIDNGKAYYRVMK